MDARSLLKLDAAFEAALSLVLIIGGGFSWLTGADFPEPIDQGAVLAAGVALALLAVALFSRTRRGLGRGGLIGLALANGAAAIVAAAWLTSAGGFSTAGTAVVSAAIAGLFALAAVQMRAVTKTAPHPAAR